VEWRKQRVEGDVADKSRGRLAIHVFFSSRRTFEAKFSVLEHIRAW
jgi:hypothetical protein